MITISRSQLWRLDVPKVLRAAAAASRAALMHAGKYIRVTARSSIRPARRMREGELRAILPAEKWAAYRRAKAIAKQRGGKLRRPYAASRPGDPPHSRTGLLKRFLIYDWDASTESVVIGPRRLTRRTRDVPKVLEYGGVSQLRGGRLLKIAARPYMHPALKENLHLIPKQWRNRVRMGS